MGDTLKKSVPATIHGLSPTGEGVGKLPDGRTAFVPWTMPGDDVTLRIVKDRPRWVRAELLSVDHPAEARVEPPCPYFGVCGGCAFQHVPYEVQRSWKSRFLSDALRRVGRVPLEHDVPVEPADGAYGYRSRITFTAVRRRGRTFSGLRQADRPGRVVDIETCLLAEDAVTRVWHRLREVLADPSVVRAGALVRVTVRAMDGGVVLVWSPRCPVEDLERLGALEGVLEVWEDGADGPRRLWGEGDATETWFGARTPVPGPAFTQVNRAMGTLLLDAVAEAVGPPSDLRVVDAYAGISLTGRRLAAGGARVTAIERDPWAAAAAGRAAPEGFDVLEGDVEALLPEALPADVLILNPPRAGVAEAVTDCLLRSGPDRVLYVSCDPATLARDLGRLSAAYEVASVRGFDLFPQTPHVEALVDMRRRKGDIDA